MRKFSLLCVALVVCSSLWAQNDSAAIPSYTLDELLARAMERSTQVAVAKLNVDKAKEVMLASRSDRIPDVGVGPAVTYLHRSPSLPATTGTEALISGPGAGVQANFDTHLFELGHLNRIVDRNSMQMQSAELDLGMAERDVTYSVMSAFYDVLYDEQSLELSKGSRAAAQQHLDESQQLFNEGKIPKFDLMRAQVRLANTQPSIIRTTRLLRQDQQTLARLAGLDVTKEFHLTGALEQPLENFEYQALLDAAMRNRPDLKKMELSKQIQDTTVKIDGARDPIRFTVNGQYMHYWLNNTAGSGSPLSAYNIDFNVNFPLLGAGHSHLRRQAQEQSQVIGKQVDDLKVTTATDIAQRLAKLEESREIVQTQAANVKLAEESLRVVELSYQNGKATSLDTEDSRQSLFQSQTDYLQAIHDYAVGLLDIKKAAGLPLREQKSTP